MPDAPENVRFSEDHLWAGAEDDSLLRVGITDYAQRSLGDVIAVTPPEVATAVTAGKPCGDIESTKSLSDLIAPISGTVDRGNDELIESPDLVNTDPYGRGWIFEVRVDPATRAEQLARLMDATAYHDLTGE
jgi:glycine cleavage system H protein